MLRSACAARCRGASRPLERARLAGAPRRPLARSLRRAPTSRTGSGRRARRRAGSASTAREAIGAARQHRRRQLRRRRRRGHRARHGGGRAERSAPARRRASAAGTDGHRPRGGRRGAPRARRAMACMRTKWPDAGEVLRVAEDPHVPAYVAGSRRSSMICSRSGLYRTCVASSDSARNAAPSPYLSLSCANSMTGFVRVARRRRADRRRRRRARPARGACRRYSTMPRSVSTSSSRVRSAIGALADPRHDVAAVDEVDDEAARRRGTAPRTPGSWSCSTGGAPGAGK